MSGEQKTIEQRLFPDANARRDLAGFRKAFRIRDAMNTNEAIASSFKTWAKRAGLDLSRTLSGEYIYRATDEAWGVWQAASKAMWRRFTTRPKTTDA